MADGEVSVVGKDINAAKATNTYEVLAREFIIGAYASAVPVRATELGAHEPC
jgi:hypothetical protein